MNILFVVAHPDDEAFGPAGTIAKLAKDNIVTVVSLCKGNRPGAEAVADSRIEAFTNSCKILGAESIVYSSSDLHLDYHQALADIETSICKVKPNIVYTQNISDIHIDHSTTARACMAACRPTLNSTVTQLYMFEIPGSTDWSFGKLEPRFVPNIYVDITDYIELKKQAMALYKTETYEFPDARSIEAMETLAKYRGYAVGIPYAEAFQLVFAHDRKTQ